MKKIVLCLCLVIIPVFSFSQSTGDKTLLTVGNHKVSVDEFNWLYQKNKNQGINNQSSTITDYLDLFINFKLKVVEAENLGLDTRSSFKKEIAGYREQIAKNHLTDNATIEELTREAYRRMETEVNVSHILIKLSNNPSPEDTLAAYEKVENIQNRLKLGEPFESIARSTSDDPTVKSNGGNLGYFHAFQMVYPFENAAYENDTGLVPMPVMTKYGYHLIRINDKRESQGKVKVAHIMIAVPRGSNKTTIDSAKTKIYRIHKLLNEGESFKELAKKYSDDRNSARDGGELPWFGTGRMIPEFEKAAFSLDSNGEISKPVKTSFGWHIIKRIDKQDLKPYNELKSQLKEKVFNTGRAKIARKAFINKLKNEYYFYVDSSELSDYYNIITLEEITKGELPDKISDLNSKLFSFADRNYNQSDFNRFIIDSKMRIDTGSVKSSFLKIFSEYVSRELIDYEKQRLELKYPEFRYLMQEYHDGILLFEIMDKKVWSKAVEDTSGLKEFYKTHHQDHLTEKKVNTKIYTLNNYSGEGLFKRFFDKCKLNRMIKKSRRKNYSDKDFVNNFNQPPDTNNLTITHGNYEKGEHHIIDHVKWETGKTNYSDNQGNLHMIVINKILPPKPKPLKEIRGIITADYQDYLEKEWLKYLRDKYPVSVNKELLNSIE